MPSPVIENDAIHWGTPYYIHQHDFTLTMRIRIQIIFYYPSVHPSPSFSHPFFFFVHHLVLYASNHFEKDDRKAWIGPTYFLDERDGLKTNL